jgi:hypothetical protein
MKRVANKYIQSLVIYKPVKHMNSWESHACKHSLRKILVRTSNQYYALLCSLEAASRVQISYSMPECYTSACQPRAPPAVQGTLLRLLAVVGYRAELLTPLPLHARRVLLQAAAHQPWASEPRRMSEGWRRGGALFDAVAATTKRFG